MEKTEEMKYGLNISVKIAAEAVFEKKPVSYSWKSPARFAKGAGRVFLLEDAAEDDKEALRSFLKKYPKILSKNSYFQNNVDSSGGGLFVIGPEGSETEISLKSVWEKNGSDIVFVHAGKGASIKILDETSAEENVSYSGRTYCVIADEDAKVEVISLHRFHDKVHVFLNRIAEASPRAELSTYEFHAGGAFVKSDVEDFLQGEGAKTQMTNGSLAGNQVFDFYNVAHHEASHTHSDIRAQGIAGAHSKIVYRGLIDMKEKLAFLKGNQEGKFLLAASDAEVDAIPSLDIGSAEVSSRHALSIGHLRNEQFFFPALRGIEPYTAQSLLFTAFLMKGFVGISEETEEELRKIIQEKLRSPIFGL